MIRTPNPIADTALLSLKGFSLRFRGQEKPVVDSIDLTVDPGGTLCIVGESGCGKSVTAMALMGLLPMDTAEIPNGTLTFDGQTLDLSRQRLPQDLRGTRMAMIFQEPMTSLNPSFRIGPQIAEAILCHGAVSRADARSRTLSMLTRVGIPAPEQRFDDYPHQLSGGMRQRVMIAMALVNDPTLLIADEPTTALDVTIQAQILQLIRDIQAETRMGAIVITHDLGVVAEIADRVAVMYGGQIVEHGTVAQIFDDPQHPYTLGLIGSVPLLSGARARLATVPGTVPPVSAMPEGCRFRSRCPFAGPLCATRPPAQSIAPDHTVACHFAPLDQRIPVPA